MKIENSKLKIAKRNAFTPAPKDQACRENNKKRIFLVRGFTLIELMVAVAIVGILAAVVMVQMSSYGKKARASRAMAQASSAIPSMVSCWGNGGDVASGTNICSISSSYGTWPTLPTGYSYSGNSITKTQSASPWVFSVTNTESAPTVCCNSAMNSCGMPDSCSASATW